MRVYIYQMDRAERGMTAPVIRRLKHRDSKKHGNPADNVVKLLEKKK